jgi:hypothetical protein
MLSLMRHDSNPSNQYRHDMSFQLPFRIFLAAVLIFVSVDLTADSSDEDRNVVNYAYAVFFGTGTYEIDDQKAFIFRVPLSYGIREPSPDQPGIRLLLPVLLGFYDYDNDGVLQGSTPGDAATLSFVPGVELEYVMNDRWRLKPYGQIGFGRDLENSENALIYMAGVNSHYRFPASGEWQFALGNTVTYAGFDPDNDGTQSLGILGAGIDVISPWKFRMFGKETKLASSLIYYFYTDNPAFEQGDDRSKNVDGEIEWSLALDFAEPRKLMGIEFDRIGLGFRYGGNVRGIRVVTEFPF